MDGLISPDTTDVLGRIVAAFIGQILPPRRKRGIVYDGLFAASGSSIVASDPKQGGYAAEEISSKLPPPSLSPACANIGHSDKATTAATTKENARRLAFGFAPPACFPFLTRSNIPHL